MIPAVFGVGESIIGEPEGLTAAVDGGSGKVVLNPDAATLTEMQENRAVSKRTGKNWKWSGDRKV